MIASSLERERDTIRTLRDLSFAIEPLVLRDRGFAAAVDALAEQVEALASASPSPPTSTAGERARREGAGRALPAHPRGREPGRPAAPEADHDHRRRRTATGFTTEIEDDGMGERRRGGIDELDERVRVLNGHVTVETSPEGGTTVRVVLPPYAGARSRSRLPPAMADERTSRATSSSSRRRRATSSSSGQGDAPDAGQPRSRRASKRFVVAKIGPSPLPGDDAPLRVPPGRQAPGVAVTRHGSAHFRADTRAGSIAFVLGRSLPRWGARRGY